MIAALIRWSVSNRFLVLMTTALLVAVGLWSVARTPVDALPDLSDVQVIVRTSYPGKPPQVVEDLVTYPLTTTMLSVPGARTVRGYSFFGDSFVYVLFDDRTDPYWARSRVVEYLNQVQSRLPAGAIDEGVLVDPTDPCCIRPKRRDRTGRQAALHLIEVLDHARPGPVGISPVV